MKRITDRIGHLRKPLGTTIMAAGIGGMLALPCASADERILQTELVLDAPVERVWRLWTTKQGVESFFAPGSNIDLRLDGLYEILFAPDAEPGMRGADGMRILALEPMKRFSFTWNAPPSIPSVRGQRTQVILEFDPTDDGRTRLQFTHLGWGRGEDWDKAYEYFDRAWSRHVLPRLRLSLEHGPVDWDNLPELAPVAATLQKRLVADES